MSNLAAVRSAVAFACRRYGLDAEDAEEFASIVNLALVDRDYAVLRAWESRSSFRTYISIVVQRLALDYRIQTWGKWHASAEAKRLGALAVELEKLLVRDGRSLDEAVVSLERNYADVTRKSLQALADRFPERAPKRRRVDLEEADSVAVTHANAVEERVLQSERRSASERLSILVTREIADLPEQDRLVLQLRFEGGMTVAEIARSLRIDQKLLYRRIDHCMRELRARLERSGVASRDVLDLIGRDETVLDFALGKLAPRPSMKIDETAAALSEDS